RPRPTRSSAAPRPFPSSLRRSLPLRVAAPDRPLVSEPHTRVPRTSSHWALLARSNCEVALPGKGLAPQVYPTLRTWEDGPVTKGKVAGHWLGRRRYLLRGTINS